MKKTLLIFVAISLLAFIISGCGQLQIESTATNQAIAYAAGKGMGLGINKRVPEADADLSKAWVDMMAKNTGQAMISAIAMVGFYNDVLVIIALHSKDPYGLIGDLGAVLLIFGAEFNQEGNMGSINPVPMIVMKFFEIGYKNGRMVAMAN
jgi:hypothetical protein